MQKRKAQSSNQSKQETSITTSTTNTTNPTMHGGLVPVENPRTVINGVAVPGFRFFPYDYELILYYLRCKIMNEQLPNDGIKDVNVYQAHPAQLCANYESLGDKEWYFFNPRDIKYRTGRPPNRAAGDGYYKATGSDNEIIFKGELIGFRKALVFYEGKPRRGEKTNWNMHEYTMAGHSRIRDIRLDDFVLCKIFLKGDVKEDELIRIAPRCNQETQLVTQRPVLNNNDQNPGPDFANTGMGEVNDAMNLYRDINQWRFTQVRPPMISSASRDLAFRNNGGFQQHQVASNLAYRHNGGFQQQRFQIAQPVAERPLLNDNGQNPGPDFANTDRGELNEDMNSYGNVNQRRFPQFPPTLNVTSSSSNLAAYGHNGGFQQQCNQEAQSIAQRPLSSNIDENPGPGFSNTDRGELNEAMNPYGNINQRRFPQVPPTVNAVASSRDLTHRDNGGFQQQQLTGDLAYRYNEGFQQQRNQEAQSIAQRPLSNNNDENPGPDFGNTDRGELTEAMNPYGNINQRRFPQVPPTVNVASSSRDLAYRNNGGFQQQQVPLDLAHRHNGSFQQQRNQEAQPVAQRPRLNNNGQNSGPDFAYTDRGVLNDAMNSYGYTNQWRFPQFPPPISASSSRDLAYQNHGGFQQQHVTEEAFWIKDSYDFERSSLFNLDIESENPLSDAISSSLSNNNPVDNPLDMLNDKTPDDGQ